MYQIKKLLKFPKLIHGFSTVTEGNMSFRYGSKLQVVDFREKFLKKLAIDTDSCVAMFNVHGDETVVVSRKQAGKGMKSLKTALKVDSLITSQRGLCLFLLIADCLPVIMYDPENKVLGLVHAGWKGVDQEIVKKVIKKLKDHCGVSSSDLIVGLGPAARKESFVKEDPSQLSDLRWKGYLHPVSPAGYYQVDYVGLCVKQLIDVGVRKENVFDCKIDTVKDKRFFSHYRDLQKGWKDQGRFACVVGIKQ
jgi:YfiH family protein